MEFFPSRVVFLSIAGLQIHWYGVLYAVAFLVGAWMLRRTLPHRSLVLSAKAEESLFLSVVLGVLLGGRLGYVLLYAPEWLRDNPVEILRVWHGGMSSHGGFLGVGIALLLFTRRYHISLLALLDTLTVPIACGLALGRLGNFINGELYGTLTTVPWGMHFPGAEGLRHPTQLYAILKDLLLAGGSFLHLRRSSVPGRTTGWFLLSYALLRSLVEVFRDQPFGYVVYGPLSLSWGQLYTLPLIAIGSFILLRRKARA